MSSERQFGVVRVSWRRRRNLSWAMSPRSEACGKGAAMQRWYVNVRVQECRVLCRCSSEEMAEVRSRVKCKVTSGE
jgi:hypothetical protein